MSVTIVTCVRGGTENIFTCFCAALKRHPITDMDVRLSVLTTGNVSTLTSICRVMEETGLDYEVDIHSVKTGIPIGSPREHGLLLDWYIPSQVKTEYIMTMDSDCFPIADGWFEKIFLKDKEDYIRGILQPWKPPPDDLPKTTIEYRLRSQQCWNRTHVACQLMSVDIAKELHSDKMLYGEGDDTGLALSQWWNEKVHRVFDRIGFDGIKPTRCAASRDSTVDAEFNRYVGVVYGDAVFHLGGYTRTTLDGDKAVWDSAFGWIGDAVFQNKGAEFLLDDPEASYKYLFDREEEVSVEKMNRIFGLRQDG